MQKRSIFLTLCFSFYSLCYASSNSEFDGFIHAKMKEYHVPGVSIAIIKNKRISFDQGYGYADVQKKRKMTTDTLLQACSITKATTSLAVLLAFSNKHLSIDAPVNKYLTSWQVPKNKFTEKQSVTVRMLLNHTAGILNPYANYSFKPDDITPTALQMLQGKFPSKNPPLIATYVPGSKYEYCNGCYLVLQQLLEDVNHKPYVPLMQSLILTPLKIKQSTFDLTILFQYPESIALPYKPNGKIYNDVPFMVMMKNLAIRKKNLPGNAGISVGGLWTTPSDLATFAIAIQKSLAKERNSYIPHNIAKAMIEPSSTKTRGLGFYITNKYGDETPNGQYFMHGGFNQGYLAIFIASKTNSGDGAFIIVNVSPDYNSKDVYEWGFIRDVERYIADHGRWK